MTKLLSRHHLQIQHRATGATVRYVGRGLTFHDRLYGEPEGVFFAVLYAEVTWPPLLIEQAQQLGQQLDLVSTSRDLQRAVVDALIAEAMLNAPELLAEIADPKVEWPDYERRDLERRHVNAIARVVERTNVVASEMRARACRPTFDPGPLPVMAVMPPPSVSRYGIAMPPAPEPSPAPVAALLTPTPSAPPSAVARAQEAIVAARKAELPQRLPNGARRALERMVAAVYIVIGSGAPSVRGSLAEAMVDAQSTALDDKVEVTIIDWDGEWPVVVRRYGPDGHVMYRVEGALKRADREVTP